MDVAAGAQNKQAGKNKKYIFYRRIHLLKTFYNSVPHSCDCKTLIFRVGTRYKAHMSDKTEQGQRSETCVLENAR